LLKKLQEENPDDTVSESLDGDFSQDVDSADIKASSGTLEGAEGSKDESPDDAKVLEAEFVPAEIIKLESLLRSHDWWYGYSDDSNVRESGGRQWNAIIEQLDHCKKDGVLAAARKSWDRYAPEEFTLPPVFKQEQSDQPTESSLNEGVGYLAVRPAEPFSDPYERNLFAQPLGSGMDQLKPEQIREQENIQKQQYGSGQTDMLSKVLSAPFAVTAAAGSLILNSLKYASNSVRGFYVKGRENGHTILGQQMTETADQIIQMTTSLKEQGMGELINDMKLTGRPASEIFAGMLPGGPHQHFADRFTSLLKNEKFSETYAKLEDALTDFGFKATHYAKAGIELNKDYSEVIERNLEKISAATEGFIFKKNGVIKHLQELARSISESISNMINNLLGRHKPQ